MAETITATLEIAGVQTSAYLDTAARGATGQSAYDLAVENGFEGTEEEWLESLKGTDGVDGVDGAVGPASDPVLSVRARTGTDGVYEWIFDEPFDAPPIVAATMEAASGACIVEITGASETSATILAQRISSVSGELDISPLQGYVHLMAVNDSDPMAGALLDLQINEGSERLFSNSRAPTSRLNLFTGPNGPWSNAIFWTLQNTVATLAVADGPTGATVASSASRWVMTGDAGVDLRGIDLPAGNYTVSGWFKNETANSQTLRGTRNPFTFTPTNGTFGPNQDWTFVTFQFTIASNTTGARVGFANDGTNAATWLVWGLALVKGTTPLDLAASSPYDGSAAAKLMPTWVTGGAKFVTSGAYGLITPVDLTEATIMCAMRWPTADADSASAGLASFGYTGTNALYLAAADSSRPSVKWGSATATRATLSRLRDDNWHIVELSKTASSLILRIDGSIVAVSANTATVRAADLQIASLNLNFPMPGIHGYYAMFPSSLSEARATAVRSRMRARVEARGVSWATNPVVCIEGDSIQFQQSTQYYTALGTAYPTVRLQAVSGSTTADIAVRRAAANGTPYCWLADRINVLTIGIGTNDLVDLGLSAWVSAVTAEIAAQKAAATARGAVLYVGLCTILPSNRAGLNAARANANPVIRDLSMGNDFVIDYAADPTMGPDGTESNLTYYSDGTHPTAAGFTILSGIWKTATDAFIATL